MDVLGVIPARGGSKGIPHKNLTLLSGRPLLSYTCEQARQAKTLSRIILSTEDQEIAEFGRQCGMETPFERPQALAADDTPIRDVLRHLLETLHRTESYRPEMVVLLQPTSPLRRPEQIDAAVQLLRETGADSVVSVVPVPHQFLPVSLMEIRNGSLIAFQPGPAASRRQEKPVLYARNGPAVLAIRRAVLAADGLYGKDCRALVMKPEESVDIDTPFDLALAEFFLSKR